MMTLCAQDVVLLSSCGEDLSWTCEYVERVCVGHSHPSPDQPHITCGKSDFSSAKFVFVEDLTECPRPAGVPVGVRRPLCATLCYSNDTCLSGEICCRHECGSVCISATQRGEWENLKSSCVPQVYNCRMTIDKCQRTDTRSMSADQEKRTAWFFFPANASRCRHELAEAAQLYQLDANFPTPLPRQDEKHCMRSFVPQIEQSNHHTH